ncbi:hypothetical protein RB195_018952 [Necator americanus]|uniref:Myotubularin phosphatase domain-containing protein n=1 Tax=Necator americanus TaxID=51031 RepID=A0ABR1CBY9_NECAM
MSTVHGSNLQNSTGRKAEPVLPLPKNGTRERMWSELWKLWSWPQFPALLVQKTAAAHEAAIQEVLSQRHHRPQAVISAPAPSRILKSPSDFVHTCMNIITDNMCIQQIMS